MQERDIHVGDSVVFHDERGVARNSLVTAVWSKECLNLVFISNDKNKSDTHGRQIERESSVVHKCQFYAHGNYWRFADEEPIPYTAPLET